MAIQLFEDSRSRLTWECPGRSLPLLILRVEGPARRRHRVRRARHRLAVALADGAAFTLAARVARHGAHSALRALLRRHRRGGGRRAVAVGAGDGGVVLFPPLCGVWTEEGGSCGAMVAAASALAHGLAGHRWRMEVYRLVGTAPSQQKVSSAWR